MSLFGKRKDAGPGSTGRGTESITPAAARRVVTEGSVPPPTREAPPAPPPRSPGSAAQKQTAASVESKDADDRSAKGGQVAIIGKSIVFKGELSGDEDLEIDGNVEGDVKLPNHVLKIGAHGKVKASVMAKCVQVVGHVAGDVTATERVEVEASGVVEGDIRAPRLLVQEGAVINGAIEMTKAAGGAAKPASSETAPRGNAPEAARKAG